MIYEVLSIGAENAKTGKQLANIFNCEIRTITEQIEKERREGKAICATPSGTTPGYFIAADERELQDYCNRLHHRASELYKTRAQLLKVLKSYAEKNASVQ